MNAKAKGTRAERRAIKMLERAGYVCTKAGGSLGLFDVVAIGPVDVRCLQVKAGTARLSGVERAAIAAVPVPPNCTRELWIFRDRATAPTIERL